MKFIVLIAVIAALIFFFQRSSNDKKIAAENIQIGVKFLAENQHKPNIETLPSGLQYEILQAGTGTEHPTASNTVTVNYEGKLINGTVFDSSYARNEPATFRLNQVIKGWTEGLQLMTVGEKVRFFIPANLAYGNRSVGKIPSGSLLIFDVELLNIKA
jgi:peptidylprolyl isomerase